MEENSKLTTIKKIRCRSEESKLSKREADRGCGKTRVYMGAAASRWKELKDQKGLYSSLGQLFQRCEECRQKSVIKTEGERTCLSVTQHCHSCNHLRTWTSNSSAARTTDSEYGEKPQNSWVAEVQVALPPDDQEDSLPPDDQEDSLPPDDQEDSLPPDDQEDSLPPDDQEDSLPPDDQEASLPPDDQEASLPPEDPEASLPPEDPEASLPPEDPEASLPPEDPEASLPPEDPEASLPPEDPEASLPPEDPEASLPPEDPEASLPPEDPEASLPPEDPEASLPPEDPEASLPPEDPEASLPPEDPEATLPPEDPEATLPPEDPEATLPPEAPDEAMPPQNTGNALEWTGSLEMEVTVDQPPRPGGSGPSLVRRKEGSKGAETRMKLTMVEFDSETDSTQSQEENGLSSWERSLRVELQENMHMQLGCEEVPIDSVVPEDSETKTSQIDTEREKRHVAADWCEKEDGVCETDGGEKGETEGEDEEIDSEFDLEESEEGLTESDSDFDLEDEAEGGLTESDSDFDLEDEAEEGLTESDSDFDPEEGKSKKGSGTPLQKSTDGPMQDSRRHFVLCPECGILYSTRLQYRKCDHKFMITCPDCGKHCANEIGLKSHQKRQHSHDKIFPCKFCLQPFRTRPEKLTHQKSHRFTDYRCYSCSDCPLRFDNVFVRNRHVREHRKHICQICDKEFKKRHLLDRHNLSHSDDKPFKCQVCQRAFAQASQLKSHLRVHTGERPFQCQRCDKSFNHNVSLKNHVRRYHSPDSGPDPDGGAGGGGQGEGEGVGKKMPRQQLTFWTEWEMWAGGEGAKRVEAQPRKRKHQCIDDASDEEAKERQQKSGSDQEEKMDLRSGRSKGRGGRRVRGRGKRIGVGRGRGKGRGGSQ
ncbi:zinc finger and SCAN domain-containing protein 10 isoform X2 [Esox lucius]|uniref:zinc finger and SCAN domain-containing protein 10 isoform X2 n=1 Tax=Esox lucius TaxID=8010 RepID=UPI00147728AD|nr:zinc finger and SCAN domain-containing protein 10 isoform X2 [Esox lucius]